MKTHGILFLFTVLFWLHACPAQSQQIIFNKVLLPGGRVLQNVTGITQDRMGYMWFASKRGLYRFDGYSFVTYNNKPRDPNSLVSNMLQCIYTDSNGMIWIGTFGAGLDRLDPFTGVFTHFRHLSNDPTSLSNDTVMSILQDHQGTLWVGTLGGLNRFDRKAGHFVPYLQRADDPTSLSCNEVMDIYEDRQGTLWIGTGCNWLDNSDQAAIGGLNRMSQRTGKFTRYLHDPTDLHSLNNNKVRAIFEDSKGTFWIGTAGDGLHTMDRAKGTFERHLYNPAQPKALSRSAVVDRFDQITFITEDATGAIWIGTSGAGVNYYDRNTKQITHFESQEDAIGAFTDREAWDTYTSREGVLWISTGNGNLYRIDPFQRIIPHYASPGAVIESFLEEDGMLWIGTDSGLYRKDLSTGTVKRFLHDPRNPASLGNSYIQYLFKDSQGNIWVSTWGGGLDLFHKDSETFTHFRHDPKNNTSISNNQVLWVYEDPDKRLWVATCNGLNEMDRKRGIFTRYYIDPKDTVPGGKNFITYILKDRQGKWWVGSWYGFYQFDPRSGQFKAYIKDVTTFGLHLDGKGDLWVGVNNGLFLYDRTSDKFSTLVETDSLTSIPEVRSIIEDNQSNLWVCSSIGLVRINPQRNKSFVYGANYGVKGELFTSYCHKGSQGKLFFSDQRSYFAFYPEQLRENPNPPELVLTSFYLANKVVNPSKQGPFNVPLQQAKEIGLPYDQNAFSFDFAVFDYSDAERNRHYFMLENYDQDWRPSGVERRANYVNVPPGKYIFRVKAVNNYGIWAQKSIVLLIAPPWWRTWWFYALCAGVVTAAVYALFQYRLHQKLKAYELRNTISRDLHDEVGSTLSSIRLLSSMALEDASSNQQKTQSTLSSINESANKMLDAMSDIIWNIQPQHDALEHMIPRMISFASELLEAQKITLNCYIADNVKQLHLPLATRHDFLLIFKEAVNNLAKYSGATEVTISITYKYPLLTLIIQDNGRGFEPGKQSPGNGLSNMQSRAQKMGAKYQLNTGMGKGTTITLQVKPTS